MFFKKEVYSRNIGSSRAVEAEELDEHLEEFQEAYPNDIRFLHSTLSMLSIRLMLRSLLCLLYIIITSPMKSL